MEKQYISTLFHRQSNTNHKNTKLSDMQGVVILQVKTFIEVSEKINLLC